MNAHLDTIESPAGLVAFATDDEGGLPGLAFLEGSYPLMLDEDSNRDGFDVRWDAGGEYEGNRTPVSIDLSGA